MSSAGKDTPDFSRNARCLACASKSLHFFGTRDRHRYDRCGHCGTLQLNPMPSAAFLAEAYSKNYAVAGHCQGDPAIRNKAAVPQYDALCDALGRSGVRGRILDHGCGWGGLLLRLKERGIAAEGLEPSDAMAAYCEALGFTVLQEPMEALPGEGVYDALLLSSVFEHLTEHGKWLQAAHRLLVPGGVLISLQPTARFAALGAQIARLGRYSAPLPALHQVFSPPWHTTLFSLKGMRLLLEQHGFLLESISPAPLQREMGMTGVIQNAVRLVNACAFPFFGVHWPLWIGHIFTFRKPLQ